jgi:hypothetical protein
MNWYKKAQFNKLSMNVVEFVRKLRKHPDVNITQKGKKLINLDNGLVTIVHDQHRGDELLTGTMESMLKGLGLDKDILLNNSRKSRRYRNKKTVEPVPVEEKKTLQPSWQNDSWFQNQQQYEE